jgi:biopolymer transport protein ExbB
MRSYNSSTFRFILLAAVLVFGLFLTGSSFGQDAAAAAGTDAPEAHKESFMDVVNLVMGQWSDPITITIAILSIAGLTFIIQGSMKNRISVFMPEETTNQIREMIGERKFKELIEFTETDPSFVSRAINPALKRAPSFSSMKEAMETAIGEQTAEQFRKIEYLNIIGNLGPLLGLMGTVVGMIMAFSSVAATHGQADVGQLSAGIAKALCHTFLGLFLAVPCLAAFGVLRTIVDRLTVRGALVAEELLLMIKPQEKATATPARPSGTPAPQPASRKMPAPIPTPPPSTSPAAG